MPSASRSAYLLTVLAAGACAGAPAPKSVNDTALRRETILVLMAEDVVDRGNYVQVWHHEPMDDGCSPARYGTVRPRL